MQETADAKGQRSGRAGIRNQPAWFDRRDSAFQSRTPWGGSRARCDDRVCAGRNADNLAHPCSRMDRRTGWISRIRLERKRSASLSAGSWCNWAYRFAFVPYKRNGLARDRVAASLVADELTDIGPGIRLWDKGLLCTCEASLFSWWVDGEINRVLRKEAQIMKERGKKVLALIPLNLDGFLFSADYQGGKKAEITSRVAANFVGWEKDHALFDRELEKVIRALRTGEGGREIPPPARL